MTKRRLVKVAKEAQLHSGEYAFAGRRMKKSQYRRLWITRISQAVKKENLTYSQFMSALKKAQISLDRKMLSYLVTNDQNAFKAVIERAKSR